MSPVRVQSVLPTSCSTDMAAIRQRITEEKADWIIYVTDVGQSQHFKGVFKAARMAGWLPEEGSTEGPKVDHVGFGLVLGEDGKRLRTRNATDVRNCNPTTLIVSRYVNTVFRCEVRCV
jgi:arginyl-tRNA synthetase